MGQIKMEDRFFKKVDKVNSLHEYAGDKCWEWVGAISKNGYGAFGVGYKMVGSHRVSYAIHFGEIPDGLIVCHRCDNKICVNPSHLFLGTQKDNIRDKLSKGRQPNGESHYNHKLTTEQVIDLRQKRLEGRTQASLALEFGIAFQTVSDICLYRHRKVA